MKKIISAFLTLALVLTMVLSIPFSASAIVTNTVLGKETTVISNLADNTTWFTGKQSTSSGIVDWNANATTYLSVPNSVYSYGILEAQNASVQELVNFEWNAQLNLGNGYLDKFGFLLHVDTDRAENATVLNTFNDPSLLKNCIAVSFASSQVSGVTTASASAPSTNMHPRAINIFIPGEDGYLIPLGATEYSASQIKDKLGYGGYSSEDSMVLANENGYLSLDNFDLNQYLTISIRFNGKLVTVTVSGKDFSNNDITAEKTFNIPYSALDKAPSGDIAIATGNDSSKFRKINVKYTPTSEPASGLIFDSTKLDTFGFVWADNNNSPTGLNVEPSSKDGALTLPGGIATTPILKENGYKNTKLTDFVWEFQYKPNDAENNETSFLFHVDTERELNEAAGVYYPTMIPSGKNIGLKESTDKNRIARLYLGVTLYGSSDKFKTQPYAWENALTIDWSDRTAEYNNAQFYSDTDDSYTNGSINKPVSYVPIKTVDGNGELTDLRNDVYYNVKVMMTGSTVIVAIWQDGFESETYSQAVCDLNSTQITRCISGDFAIVQENETTSGSLKNMKIYNGTDAFISDEDYSEYAGFETEYTFENDTEGFLYSTTKESASISQENGMFKINTAGDTLRLRNFDRNNDNLKDFIAKFDISATENYVKSHDQFYFRRTDEYNSYRIRFRMVGGGSDQNYDPGSNYGNCLLVLEKIVDGSVTLLAQVPLGFGFIKNQGMTLKVSAIGDEIKIWYAGKGTVYAEPLISVTDSSNEKGVMAFDFYASTRYLDNICIYDITAKEYADKVDAIGEVTREKRVEIAELEELFAGLNISQAAKLANKKALLTETILPAIEDIEFNAMKINDDEFVDARDIVSLKKIVANNETLETADPEFDGLTNAADTVVLRKYVLGDKYY